MTETFEVSDAVEYEDAYTGELKHGRITSMSGGDAMIRTITKKEAGKNPKRLRNRGSPAASRKTRAAIPSAVITASD